jgi:hypothetical protein
MLTPAVLDYAYQDFRRAMKKLDYPLPSRNEYKQFIGMLETQNSEVSITSLEAKQLFVYTLGQYLNIIRMPDKKEQEA